jgi:DNA-directed RNA polymerase alpha subunit
MSAKIENLKETDEILTFTISGVDVSYVNAVRRTILSDIPIVCFKTTPHESNKANISVNTTRLNNEILKQRLSCIPICIKDLEIPIKNYMLELDVENKTDTIMYVTTKDFKIKNITTDTYLEEGDLRKIFPTYVPPTGKGEYFIDFVRLRPKLSEELPGEKIKLTCALSIGTARDDGAFNVTGTCSYGCTPDDAKIVEELAKRKQKWADEGKSEAAIEFEAANWKLLEGLRYVKRNSFDFIIQTVGIYENPEIIIKACQILMDKFVELKQILDKDAIDIHPADSTIDACYDIILENEDYTIGNILNYELYGVYYRDLKKLSYVGFKKMHPHDTHSVLRMAFTDATAGKDTARQMLAAVFEMAYKEIRHIKGLFDGGRK